MTGEGWGEGEDTIGPTVTADLIAHFHQDMSRGLAGRPRSISMQPSFVSRPAGSERGRFVALDLGGTNVRATVTDLPGDGSIQVLRNDSFRLTETSGSASDLFDPIAEFLGGILDDGTDYSLGFIFAFPIDQDGIRTGRLSKWTKEFAFDGVEGMEVVALLQNAIDRQAAETPALGPIRVSALANDTVGVLAAGAYLDPRCDIGLIVGTGTNLAVAAPMGMIGRRVASPAGNPAEMLINMECGNFNGVRSIQTDVDRQLDYESDTEGQLIEKMISGRYLGEVVRLQVADMAANGTAFIGWISDTTEWSNAYAVTTEHVSDFLHDSSRDLTAMGMILGQLGLAETSPKERRLLLDICTSVAKRSAHLVALSIVATATYIDPELRDPHVVAVDGSVFRGIPGYQTEVERAITEIASDYAHSISLAYLRDGSSLGAAVIAAVAAEA